MSDTFQFKRIVGTKEAYKLLDYIVEQMNCRIEIDKEEKEHRERGSKGIKKDIIARRINGRLHATELPEGISPLSFFFCPVLDSRSKRYQKAFTGFGFHRVESGHQEKEDARMAYIARVEDCIKKYRGMSE